MTTDLNAPTETKKSPGRYWLDLALETPDPGSMIGAALTGLLAISVESDEAEANVEAANDDYIELRREYDDLEAHLGRCQQTIDDILAVCKKSRGQLAEKVREVVDQGLSVHTSVDPTPDPAPEPDPVVPPATE